MCNQEAGWNTLNYAYNVFQKYKLIWKTVQQFLKQLNIDSLYDPSIPFLDMFPREMDIHVHKKLTHECSCSITHNDLRVEIIEITQIYISWQMDKQNVVYPLNRMLFISRKK